MCICHITTVDAYRYTDHLLALERCTPAPGPPISIPGAVRAVRSPLNVNAWKEALRDHPDQRFVKYMLAGLVKGFHLGFERSFGLFSARRNLPSAVEQEDILAGYIEKSWR